MRICKDICEEGNCKVKVPLGKELSMREVAGLFIDVLASEEVEICCEPKGRFLWALSVIAAWLGIAKPCSEELDH